MANSTSDSIQNGARNASQTGVKAARTVKTAEKAAASAATGNYVGAVVQLAKEQNIRRIIIALIAINLALIILVCILAPLAIFEGVHNLVKEADNALLGDLMNWKRNRDDRQNKWNQLKEFYLETRESSEGSKGSRIVKAATALVGKVLEDSWNNMTRKWNAKAKEAGDAPADGSQGYSDEDVIIDDLDMAHIYERKIKATQNAVNRRLEEIKNDIMYTSDFYKGGDSSSWLYQRMYTEFLENEEFHQGKSFGTCPNYEQYKFEGVSLSVQMKECTPKQALELLCLYEVMTSDTPDDIQSAGYMEWLGLEDSDNNIEYAIGNNGYIRRSNKGDKPFKARKGGFMPKYLCKEELDTKYDENDSDNPYSATNVIQFVKNCINNKTARKKYMAYKVSPIDLIIRLDGQILMKCEPIISRNVSHSEKEITGSDSCLATSYDCVFENLMEPLRAQSLSVIVGGSGGGGGYGGGGYGGTPIGGYGGGSGGVSVYSYNGSTVVVPGGGGGGGTIIVYPGSNSITVYGGESDGYSEYIGPNGGGAVVVPSHEHNMTVNNVQYNYNARVSVRNPGQIINAACLYDGRVTDAPSGSVNANQHQYSFIDDSNPRNPTRTIVSSIQPSSSSGTTTIIGGRGGYSGGTNVSAIQSNGGTSHTSIGLIQSNGNNNSVVIPGRNNADYDYYGDYYDYGYDEYGYDDYYDYDYYENTGTQTPWSPTPSNYTGNNRVVKEAASWLGTPYELSDRRIKGVGVECVGLVIKTYNNVGYRMGSQLVTGQEDTDWFAHSGLHDYNNYQKTVYDYFDKVDRSQIQPGDTIVWQKPDGRFHVGIYEGDGVAIHAGSGQVKESCIDLGDGYSVYSVLRPKEPAPSPISGFT